ncbi:hypothetical protein BP6252_10859 [Coleophoma cylindrospora]|uniref:Zn(2)-C6 fungal-type domain-containing protein n=1 Tax=Coleophoma cylindrospora TaxID=1849047 RepID=A0A3D8QPE1_9HELO|nr:hypothetical protein BP6252_10859 [Coleophoma cylindrospora]
MQPGSPHNLANCCSSSSCARLNVLAMKAAVAVGTRKQKPGGTKVRTGCVTCKARKLKCDEGKPACTRCLKLGFKCGGYLPPKPTGPKIPPGQVKNLLAKQQAPLCRTPTQRLFQNNQEYGYFQRFAHESVALLTGVRASDFWTRVVLQASEAESSIRHAATAIGALILKHDGDLDRDRREFAYTQYHKALMGVRKGIITNACDVRTKLISCVLFACFESYHGNNEAAVSQIFAGVEMIDECSRGRDHGDPGAAPIDDELVASFRLLEIQASAWGDQREPQVHLERMRVCAELVSNMPAEFTNLKEASDMLSHNMLRAIHLRHSQKSDTCENRVLTVPPFLGVETCSSGPAISQLSRIVSTFREWNEAFQPLYQKSMSPEGRHLFEGAMLLRMHYYGTLLWCASGSLSTDFYYRRYTKELKAMVELGKYLLKLVPVVAESSFSMDMCIVLPLAVIGWNYRHRALRQEVISIFLNMAKRESIWNAPMVGMVMKWMSEIEEEGLGEEEYVPEDVVANIANMQVDEARRSVVVSCVQGIKGIPGETVFKETTLYW